MTTQMEVTDEYIAMLRLVFTSDGSRRKRFLLLLLLLMSSGFH